MKNKTCIALLILFLVAGCSKPAAPPPQGSQSGGPQAGEGVTWDKIGASPGAGGASGQAAPQKAPGPMGGPSAPQIVSANFVAGAGNGEAISVNVSTVDADGDPVTVEYAWTVNGQPAGNDVHLQKPTRRGDFITVTLTPFDGKERGRSVTLRSQVNNSPPRIAGVVDVRIEGDLYTARVQAEDPDGEPVRYALVSGPNGMTVDPAEGTIRWNMPADYKGQAVFMVSARDRSGAQSTYAATIEVKETFE
ncbi:MAG TPA: putative Ig domain-containing protein [Candidatus Deferrimicrobiaceae bacterium]